MPRSTRAAARNRRKKKIFREARGYFGGRSNLYRTAKDAVEKGWEHAYRDRRKKKRNFRRLWIARINAAARQNGLSYSRLMPRAAPRRDRARPQGPGRSGDPEPGRLRVDCRAGQGGAGRLKDP